jgi:Na+-driven multidrug efflux pump
MTSVISLGISLIGIVFGEPVMRLFTNDATVIEIGRSYLAIVTGFYVVFSTMFIVGAVMRGAGDTFIPMLITLFALWAVRIPLCYWLSEEYGHIGLWWGIPIAWIVGLSLSYMYYLSGRWRKKVLVRQPLPSNG